MVASIAKRVAAVLRGLSFVFMLVPAFAFAQSADIVVNHSDSPDPGSAGGTFTYTIRLDNNGPNDAANVRVADTLPPGSTFVSATTTAGSCAPPAAGVVDCTIGDIAFTQSQTVQIKVRLPTAGVWTNRVSAISDTSDPNLSNNTNDPEDTTAIIASDIALTASAPATITAGQGFNYTLTAQNLGPDPVPSNGTLAITFTVAAGVSITSAPSGSGWTCTASGGYPLFSGGTISCTHAGPLAVGAAASALTVPAVTNVAGTVTAAFNVTSTMPDGDLANNTATVSVDSAYGSDVSISFSSPAAGTTYAQGSNVSYTLVPRYNGGLPPGSTGSQIITVTDTLGAGLTFASASGGGWTCGASGQVVTCTRPGPYSGGKFTNMPAIMVVATATGLGTLNNSATISIPETDPVPGNNSANVNVSSSNDADLRMTKTASLSPLIPGQAFSFSLTVRNLGPLAVGATQTITVNDTIPAGVTVTARPTGTGWSCLPATGYPLAGPGTISCTRNAALGSGANAPAITVPVSTSATGTITNTACASLSGAGAVDSNNANDCNSATVTTTAAQADLAVVSKTASPNPVNAGENLTYTISVVNNGPDAATNATVTDTLASLVSSGGFQSAVPSQGSCTPSGLTNATSVDLSCNLGTLNAGATANVIVIVRPSIAATGLRSNTATINSPDIGDPDRTNNSASVTSTVNALVDITAAKTATPSPVRAGTPLTYVVTVRNNGPSTAQTVALTDTLPANAAFVSLDSVSGGGSCPTPPAAGQIGGALHCNWTSIASGTQYTVTYKVRPLASAAGGTVANSASVTTATQEFNTTNNSTSTSTPVTAAQLDILVNKADNVDPVLLGDSTVYTILINNAGPSYGTNVRLTDVFPAPPPANASQATFSYEGGLTVDSSGTCVEPPIGVTGGTLNCSFPGLAAGQTATVTYKMTARTLTVPGAFAGTAFNQASVSVDETETTLANNQVVHDTTARRFSENADLGVTKTTAATSAAPGALIDYVITVTNAGPAASTTAQVLDNLPASVTLVSAPGCTSAGSALTCAVGALAVGASKTFNVQVRLDPVYGGANPLVNSATLDAPGDPNPLNNSSTASTPVAGPNLYNADLALAIVTSATTVAPGGTIAYTLTVTNHGPQASNGSTVDDRLPTGTSFVSGAGCSEAARSVSCTVGALANGASKTFTVTLKLDNPYGGVKPLVNTANVNAPGDPDTTNNDASASTPVQDQDTAVSSIPTLSEWAMLLLAALMFVLAASARQRGQRH